MRTCLVCLSYLRPPASLWGMVKVVVACLLSPSDCGSNCNSSSDSGWNSGAHGRASLRRPPAAVADTGHSRLSTGIATYLSVCLSVCLSVATALREIGYQSFCNLQPLMPRPLGHHCCLFPLPLDPHNASLVLVAQIAICIIYLPPLMSLSVDVHVHVDVDAR
ncbi:hypothetical protein ACLKA7_016698 [Drosophila subpalustris]